MTKTLRPQPTGEAEVAPAAPSGPAASQAEAGPLYREGMSRLAAAVSLVTTDGPAGLAGFTATAVTSVSDNPPILLVCMHRTAQSRERLLANGRFAVNVLAEGGEALAEVFAGRTGLHLDARFQAGTWTRGASGSPLLQGAAVAFECRLADVKDVATHHVIFGEVVGVHLGPEAKSLAWLRRGFHAL